MDGATISIAPSTSHLRPGPSDASGHGRSFTVRPISQNSHGKSDATGLLSTDSILRLSGLGVYDDRRAVGVVVFLGFVERFQERIARAFVGYA